MTTQQINEIKLTTIDNPYNPWTQPDDWDTFDRHQGYNTLAYIDRVANFSSYFSDDMQEKLYNEAIDEILENDFLGIYTISKKPKQSEVYS